MSAVKAAIAIRSMASMLRPQVKPEGRECANTSRPHNTLERRRSEDAARDYTMEASMMQPFLISSVSGELAVSGAVAMAGAITALWRRANVLQDRQQAQDAANLALMVDLVERVVASLDKNTAAIKEMLDVR